MTTFPYHRIVVIGATGCGKSTLAQKLAQRLDLEYIELDALYWKPNWVESSDEEFYARVEIATRAPRWALAGNYRAVRELVWSRAEAVIWLDYPLLIILGRLLRRILKRWLKKELLWGTNYESFWTHLKLWSADSLIHWLFKTYWRRKREYTQLLALSEYFDNVIFSYSCHCEERFLRRPRSVPKG